MTIRWIARAGGLAYSWYGEDELNYQINKAMRNLYREGFRRFRCVRQPRTGDDVKVAIYAE
jgi:hypothetical protein